MQVVSRERIRLRVYERNVGETLACGTGACAAVVAGIRSAGSTRRSMSRPAAAGSRSNGPGAGHSVFMTGPAETVFEGEIEL